MATNTLFMAFPDVHDVCHVKERYSATFLSRGSLGHLILRVCAWGLFGGNIV